MVIDAEGFIEGYLMKSIKLSLSACLVLYLKFKERYSKHFMMINQILEGFTTFIRLYDIMIAV